MEADTDNNIMKDSRCSSAEFDMLSSAQQTPDLDNDLNDAPSRQTSTPQLTEGEDFDTSAVTKPQHYGEQRKARSAEPETKTEPET